MGIVLVDRPRPPRALRLRRGRRGQRRGDERRVVEAQPAPEPRTGGFEDAAAASVDGYDVDEEGAAPTSSMLTRPPPPIAFAAYAAAMSLMSSTLSTSLTSSIADAKDGASIEVDVVLGSSS